MTGVEDPAANAKVKEKGGKFKKHTQKVKPQKSKPVRPQKNGGKRFKPKGAGRR